MNTINTPRILISKKLFPSRECLELMHITIAIECQFSCVSNKNFSRH